MSIGSIDILEKFKNHMEDNNSLFNTSIHDMLHQTRNYQSLNTVLRTKAAKIIDTHLV